MLSDAPGTNPNYGSGSPHPAQIERVLCFRWKDWPTMRLETVADSRGGGAYNCGSG
jgi:hypothetical protein